MLLEFALLSLPSATIIVFPLASFAAVIFVTNRLKNDAELTILQSSGLSPWRMGKAYFLFGFLCMLILSFFTIFIVPNTTKILHERQLDLDTSVSAQLLKEGKFIHPFKGVTFYFKEIKSDGTLSNVFLHDRRNKDEFITYTATRAFLAKDENKTALYMENGLIQTSNYSSKELSTTNFKSVTIDLSNALEKLNRRGLPITCLNLVIIEQYHKNRKYNQVLKGLIGSELHTRMHKPIFAL